MQKLVFIVDDSDCNLTKTALALENDFRVLTMLSATKMFLLLEKKRPDVILLDIEMPEMDGFEAIAKLKENEDWKNIPVVFLTGHKEEAVLSKGISAGALEVVEKSVDAASLLEIVKKAVGG